MDFAGRFGPQIHDEVGPAQRKRGDPRAGGGYFVAAVVSGSGFQRGNHFDAAREQAALAFQGGDGGVDSGDLLCGLGAADDNAGDAGPDGGTEVRKHEFGFNLDENFRAAGFDGAKTLGNLLAGRGFVGLGNKFHQVENDYIRADLVSPGDAFRTGHRN